jgi:hypothetical protein
MDLVRNIYPACLAFLLSLLLISCSKSPVAPEEPIDSTPTLIFNSGFEPGSEGVPGDAHQVIQGKDLSYATKNDWLADLNDHAKIGDFSIQYQGGDASERYALIIDDPTNPGNKVLKYWLDVPNVIENNVRIKGRIQANIYGNNNILEMSHSSRVYLHPDFDMLRSASATISWLTIYEYWNNPSWLGGPYPFRITVNINKTDEGPVSALYFGVHGQIKENEKWINQWEEVNTTIPVPIGEWYTAEISFREGNASTGRFTMSITTKNGSKSTVFDITNFTHHPNDPDPDGLSHFNPLKLYTSAGLLDSVKASGKTLQIYWDDFELKVNE